MGSILTPTTYRVTITEEHIVNNNMTKNTIVYDIPNVTNVDHRVLTCPATTSIDLFTIDDTIPGAGQFVSSSVKYARISNLDNAVNIAVTISGSQGMFTQKLAPVSSMFLAGPEITSSFSASFGDSIQKVMVYPIEGKADVEYVLINA